MKDWGRNLGDSVTLAFELVLPALLGALLGYLVDLRLNSFPAVLAAGLFAGAALGFWNVVRRYLRPE